MAAWLNVPVKGGRVEIEWANRLVLKEVALDDRNGERLFEADHVSAGFRLWPILRKKWIFTTVRLFGFSLHLTRETVGSPLNAQFVLDAFASKDTTARREYPTLQIHSVLFRRGDVSYRLADAPEKRGFDAGRLQIRNISGQIFLETMSKDSLNMHVRKLSFEEHAGLRLEKLSTDITGSRRGFSAGNLNIRLPGTQLQIPEAYLRFSETDSVATLAGASVGLRLAPSHVCLRDLAALVPAFRHFPEQLDVSTEVSGFPDDLTVRKLTVKHNSALSLRGKMELKGLLRPGERYLSGRIDRLQLEAGKLADIVSRLPETPAALPAPVARLGDLDFSGEIAGFIDHLAVTGKWQSDIGSIEMDMHIGRRKEENGAFFLSGQVVSSELYFHTLFDGENPFGTVRFAAELDAARPAGGALAGTIYAQVYQLDYNRYRYRNILLAGQFGQQEFSGRIDVDDPNARLHAEGHIKNRGEESAFRISARLTDCRPDRLHIAGRYDQPQLALSLTADFTGNHPDNFAGRIRVHDFSFLTALDSFRLDTLEMEAVNAS